MQRNDGYMKTCAVFSPTTSRRQRDGGTHLTTCVPHDARHQQVHIDDLEPGHQEGQGREVTGDDAL
jgi:hypothetical protein